MKKIAIIGSGISGLTCAYHLAGNFDISVFEKADYIGGHTHTVHVTTAEEEVDIDTGFIVFNDRTYPNFIKLMDEIGVEYQPTEMSFSVRNDACNLEYNGHSLSTLFAQQSNIFRLRFLLMLNEIVRFNRDVRRELQAQSHTTIGEYLAVQKFSLLFQQNYLLPMISAIWSMGLQKSNDFPLQFFARFFANHGLLDITGRPQWYTIKGGSSNYITPLTRFFSDRIRLNTPVTKVSRGDDSLSVITDKGSERFDEVIFACHGDQALKLLAEPTTDEKNILRNFLFSDNRVILHTDASVLPRRKRAWASWNYRVIGEEKSRPTLTYNMNILQRLQTKNTYLVSLNQDIEDKAILQEFNYSHPVYSSESIAAQQQWQTISGRDRIHFCGAYWQNGFHEDGVDSALRVCSMFKETA